MGHYDPTSELKKPWIETPLIESTAFSKAAGCRIFLKIETIQPSGSFKSRGIGNLVLRSFSDPSNYGKPLHFFSSSGGNAGLAAVVAARSLQCSCTVVVPHTTKPMMIERLRAAGASHVIIHGASWTDADAYLRKTFIDDQDATSDAVARNIYVPPFDHPYIWQGAETLVDEMAKQLPPRDDEDPERCSFPADVIVCSVGGGGLLNGLVGGLERHLPAQPMGKVRIVAAETAGADSLAHSLRQGSLQSLPAVSSEAITLGALCVSSQTFKYAHHPPHGIEVRSVVGTDADAARGVVQLSDMLRLEVELSCGISVQVGLDRLRELLPDLTPDSRVVIIVCGGSTISPEMIAEYRQQLNNGWK